MRYAVLRVRDVQPVSLPPVLLSGRPETPVRRAAYGLLERFLSDAGFGGIDDLSKDDLGRPFHLGHGDLFLSLAHSGDLVGAALCEGQRIGIDIETHSAYDAAIADLVLTPGEQSIVENAEAVDDAFLRLWVRKEAIGKALGVGIDDDVLACDAGGDSIVLRGIEFHLTDIEVPEALGRGALAVQGDNASKRDA